MIAAHHFGIDPSVDQGRSQSGRGEEIVDSPPKVALPDLWHIGPPGIGVSAVWMEMTECIEKPGL